MLEILKTVRVLPVIEIDNADDAVPLAEALVAGGVTVFEFT
ncbi:MAG: keto-deoxy-phosphogluconate aldolase, partial [Pseudomonadota bacterium]